jgi:hypothetical protein
MVGMIDFCKDISTFYLTVINILQKTVSETLDKYVLLKELKPLYEKISKKI